MGSANRLVNARYEGREILWTFDSSLNHSKFITAQTRNAICLIETILQACSHGFQKFIADPMPERVIDVFEFVNVNVEQGYLLVIRDPRDRPFKLLLKSPSIRQIRQRIKMRQVRDPFVGAFSFGDVFQCRYPSAICQRLDCELYRTAVRNVDNIEGSLT